ncbi:Elicitor-responsive protein 3 [Sesamum alatum]|uniref:Elicitor-responsive protein 3 n=1 Tax=Sesamum alatum TaxID=300844 RepID=A0AAE1XW27_9LAMI|nr:Elicitor-responsive protein 3 [Sesamum alatum]
MPQGTLEVVLVSAIGLENTDFLANMDPYVIITCESEEKKSKVASGQGCSPKWNETFLFTVSSGAKELNIRILDKDNYTADDFVGEANIPLAPVFDKEEVPPTTYNVVKDDQYCGGIRIGLKFTRQRSRDREFPEEELGGWTASSRD